MKRAKLSRRERRVVLIGAGTILGLVGLTRGLPAWREWEREARLSDRESARELARAEGSVRELAATRDTLSARRSRLVGSDTRVLEGESAAAAAGMLASTLSDLAADAGVRLGATQVQLDSASRSVYERVAVRVDATGDVRGVSAFLAAIESDSVLLAVRSLSISQPEPAAPGDRPELLRVELVVEGLSRGHRMRGRM